MGAIKTPPRTIKWIQPVIWLLTLLKRNLSEKLIILFGSLQILALSLFKREENFETYSSYVKIEANKIALDITKEEKEYLKIKEIQLFLFYS